ncbi:hypothetical protein [Acanthopleuribacter pedis]|uniref:Uncharacterized protein n=1 Tax=Acanthopleuribacter pedis TaxID=442870 RepID=A0A8J7QNZ8_9BACT|nr:hypothetical protein [Acanthopleuribacter pedis]MBO1321475.1 hypothetical protein [Acanthopleuribacter pedis]
MLRNVLLSLIAFVFAASAALAQSDLSPSFRMIQINGPDVNESVSVHALSDYGHVLGRYGSWERRLFVIQPYEEMRFLDEDLLYPADINNSGYAVGGSYPNWISINGTAYDLQTPGGSDDLFINDKGQIAGNYNGSRSKGYFMKSFKAEEWVELGDLGGNETDVLGLNNNGQVVGSSKKSDGRFYAFVWNGTSGMTELNISPGPWRRAEAYGINDRGDIVAGNQSVIYTIEAETGTQEFMLVPAGGRPRAVAINNLRQVVGTVGQSGDTEPFFYQYGRGRGQYLADLVTNMPSDVTSFYVVDINNRGQILAVTYHANQGILKSWILQPRRSVIAYEP